MLWMEAGTSVWVVMTDRKTIENDYIQLARIALTGRPQDIQLALYKAAKRHREAAPKLSADINALLREQPSTSTPLRRQSEVPLPVDMDSRLHLMRVEERPALAHEPVLMPAVEQSLRQLVRERTKADALLALDIEPTRTALFTGPPGVGKTMAARWIARELGKPLIILDLAAVMSSYLGRTGANLRHVLSYAKGLDCVLLLDELDAIAKRRDDRGEIGELKRLVTVLLQQVDDWPSSGLLLAATNHADLLDPAAWRRFERLVEFPLPDAAAIAKLVEALLGAYVTDACGWGEVLGVALKGRSFSDVEREILNTRRSAAIDDVKLEERLPELLRPAQLAKADRIDLAAMLVERKLMSQRRAKELTGVSRDTIRSRRTTAAAHRNSAA